MTREEQEREAAKIFLDKEFEPLIHRIPEDKRIPTQVLDQVNRYVAQARDEVWNGKFPWPDRPWSEFPLRGLTYIVGEYHAFCLCILMNLTMKETYIPYHGGRRAEMQGKDIIITYPGWANTYYMQSKKLPFDDNIIAFYPSYLTYSETHVHRFGTARYNSEGNYIDGIIMDYGKLKEFVSRHGTSAKRGEIDVKEVSQKTLVCYPGIRHRYKDTKDIKFKD